MKQKGRAVARGSFDLGWCGSTNRFLIMYTYTEQFYYGYLCDASVKSNSDRCNERLKILKTNVFNITALVIYLR